jgi:hypothetical protein
MEMIAALYVRKNGHYYGIPDVDPWDESRDARLYSGPWPVVAHPPCARWCQLAGFVESRTKGRLKRGEDGGTFASALDAVRRWGGVLEHPAYSKAWEAFGLVRPLRAGGWSWAGDGVGFVAMVYQQNYGHVARKATWVYVAGVELEMLPALRWGVPKEKPKAIISQLHLGRGYYDETIHSYSDRIGGHRKSEHATKSIDTPSAFRDVLINIARSVNK